MSAMIYDPTSQAFVEAETPMKFDTGNQSWADTTGLAYNPEAGAWEEKWSADRNFYFIKNGKAMFSYRRDSDQYSIQEEYNNAFRIYGNFRTGFISKLYFENPINFSKYSKLCIDIEKISGSGSYTNSESIILGSFDSGYNPNKLGKTYIVSENNGKSIKEIIDISSWDGDYYLGMQMCWWIGSMEILINNISLME